MNDLADSAGIKWDTADNFYRRVTKNPSHRTIYRLAKAVKMDLQLVKEELALT